MTNFGDAFRKEGAVDRTSRAAHSSIDELAKAMALAVFAKLSSLASTGAEDVSSIAVAVGAKITLTPAQGPR